MNEPIQKINNESIVKLAIVDDDEAYRTSLKTIFKDEPRIMLYREYTNGLDFIKDVNSPFQPDVCLIDYKLNDISGIECAKKTREKNPYISLIIMTAYPDIETFYQARELGADYIEKSARAESLFKKIILSYDTAETNNFFSVNNEELNHTHLKLIHEMNKVKKRLDQLSPSQIEILKLKKEGKSIKEISKIMNVHPGTVGTQLSRAYEKLNLPHLLDYLY